MINCLSKKECTGCKLCKDICPSNAIEYEVNGEGFWSPSVDDEKCVKCGLCIKKCPIISPLAKEKENLIAYAAWNRNDEIRHKSTSGGLYYAFAEYVLNNGGYIVGSVYSDDYQSAHHIVSNSFDGLNNIMGSKYFQSDTEGIYAKTKTLLDDGKSVLFTGTPCQISALNKYLEVKYDNLITIDFICRGVPSPMIHKKKIELYEKKKKSKVVSYRDKCDKHAWIDFGELIKYENGKEQFISRWEDDINDCFVDKNYNIRESCYKCKLKNGKNDSDITIGDFWGIREVTDKDLKLGISALIVNTVKGNDFIGKLTDKIYFEKRPIDEIKRGNPAYVEAVERPLERDSFFESVNQKGLERTVNIYTRKTAKEKIVRKKNIIKSKFRKYLPVIKIVRQLDILKFVHYNFFSKKVIRDKDAFFLPCKGTELKLAKSSSIVIHGNVLLNYYPCYKRGEKTTLLRVERGARFIANNRIEIAYGNTISVDADAKFETGYLFTGMNTNIICHHDIEIGNNVMLGRDVCIFDSDYHPIFDDYGTKINSDKKVQIDDNVWIGARSMVLKGSHINNGAIVSACSMVMGTVEENRVFINKREGKSVGTNIVWER